MRSSPSLLPLLVLTSCLLATRSAAADPPVLHPATVGKGPVLFLTQPDESSGHREEALFVADPTAAGEAQRVLTVKSNLHVLARVDANRFLIQLYQEPRGLYLADLAKGTFRKLDPEGRPDLLGVVGTKVYFVSSARSAEYGYKIKDGKVASQPHPSLVLYVADVDREEEAAAVSEDDIERALELRDGACWAVVHGAPPELRRIALDGSGSRKVLELGDDVMPNLLTHALSPSGNLLAVGIAHTNDPFEHRALTVLDLRTSEGLLSLDHIPCVVSPLSSQMPYLEMNWVNEETLRYSETHTDGPEGARAMSGSFWWVDLDVKTGKRLQERRYSGLELRHTQPPADDSLPPAADAVIPLGKFARQSWKFFFADEKEPLLDGCGKEIDAASGKAFSPDGRWLAVASQDSTDTQLIDGADKSRRSVLKRWSYELVWMPAAR